MATEKVRKSKYEPVFVYAELCGHWTTARYLMKTYEYTWEEIEDLITHPNENGRISARVYCAKCRKP